MARPSIYSPELATTICMRIAEGRSLRSICKDEDMPDASTVTRWLASGEHEEFCTQYARARTLQADAIFEECLEIADTPVEGVRTEESEDGVRTIREDMLGHRRLQVDTRKWMAGKLAPKKYGEKVEVEHGGNVQIEHVGVRDEISGRIARIAERSRQIEHIVEPDGSAVN